MNDDIPATFDDGSTTKTVEGVGKFTVAADGTVTFVPEKSFVGNCPSSNSCPPKIRTEQKLLQHTHQQ